MDVLILLAAVSVILFGFVVFFGAPYLPSLKPQINAALDLLDLRPGEVMLEIGSGDGRVALAAAKRGWKVVGYELNPVLVLISYVYTWKYRSQITIKWGNAFYADWPQAQGIYIFGLPKIMEKLHTKITQTQHSSTRLVSFSFEIPGMTPTLKKEGIFVYEYHKD